LKNLRIYLTMEASEVAVMRNIHLCVLSLGIALALTGCVSEPGPGVSRVDSSTQLDLSGYWNDTDVKIVSESLVDECLAAPRLAEFAKKTGKAPVIIVGYFRNDSDEHIDTSIIVKKVEMALVNSGKVDFVASKDERQDVRDERQDQQSWATEDSAKELAAEAGADFMLIGSVKTIVDRAGGISSRTYFVSYELIDIQSNKKIFVGENSSIKKVIRRPANKF
jgi:penicillin-binding protein activator